MMHTSVLLLGTHNRSWYIHVCELFKIFCFSPRHFLTLSTGLGNETGKK